MIGIFCSAIDLPALWVYQGLKRRGLVSLEVFTPEALVYNRRFEHRLLSDETVTRIMLADGRVLDGTQFDGVLNRINALPVEHLQSAVSDDRQYAAQEQRAVFLSWLYSLPGVLINRPGARGLCGDLLSLAEWTWLAGQAGLPTLTFHQNDQTPGGTLDESPYTGSIFQIIVLDGQIYGQRPPAFSADMMGCISRLADFCGLRLFGMDFCFKPEGEQLFASATTLPDLRLGGEEILDALAEALA